MVPSVASENQPRGTKNVEWSIYRSVCIHGSIAVDPTRKSGR